MKRLLLAAALVLVGSTSAWAQTIDSYGLWITGGANPPVLTVLPVAGFLCNQPVVTGVPVNPNKAAIPDLVNPGRECVYTDSGTGPLLALPIGATSFTAQIDARAGALISALSPVSLPFTRPGVIPPAPAGVRLYR